MKGGLFTFTKNWLNIILMFPGFFVTEFSTAQTQLLDSVQLAAKPVFGSIKQALKNPLEVYKFEMHFNMNPDTALFSQLVKCSNLQVLHITGLHRGYKTLPEFVTKFSNLQELKLWYTSYSNFSSAIRDLKNLERLYICGSLGTLPEEIGELKNLKVLYIYFSGISVLPESICNLKQLQQLTLYYSPITSLPAGIRGLENLKSLYIAGSKINSIPPEIKFLKKLEILKIENNWLLDNISHELFYLIDLRELSIIGNNILTKLPVNFPGPLENLKRLEISYTSLHSLPEMKGMNNLEFIKLYANDKLTQVPELKSLDRLTKIIISKMDNLDWETALKNLTKCKSLRKLDISENEFNQFPKNLGMLKNLQELKYKSGAQSKTIEKFNWENSIETLSKLKRLRVLDLSENKIKHLLFSKGLFKNLDSLYLSNNLFSNADSVLSSLKQTNLSFLDLSNGGLQKFPEALCHFPGLKHLDLSSNMIDSLPEDISNLINLETLNLQAQDFILLDMAYPPPRKCLRYMSPAIYALPQLRKVNISNSCLKLTKAEIQKKLPVNCELRYN